MNAELEVLQVKYNISSMSMRWKVNSIPRHFDELGHQYLSRKFTYVYDLKIHIKSFKIQHG